MTKYQTSFYTNSIYHIINRGVAQQDIFRTPYDYQRFLDTMGFYLDGAQSKKFSSISKKERRKIISSSSKDPFIEIIGYCLMPNHFHILARQLKDNGVSNFMRKFQDSYTRYFNAKNKRVGTIYQGKFKAVLIETDEQLFHVSRYIHLNPYAAKLTNYPEKYPWSSYNSYLKNEKTKICNPEMIIEMIGSPEKYRKFVADYAEYARFLSEIKKFILE